MQMLAELAISLRDDLRPHIPELLPRLVALFVDAERNSSFDMVKPTLQALEVRGSVLGQSVTAIHKTGHILLCGAACVHSHTVSSERCLGCILHTEGGNKSEREGQGKGGRQEREGEGGR